MRTYLSIKARVFEPEAVEVIVEAFDAAWAIVQRFDGVNESNREEMRQALAKRILELWDSATRDPQTLRDVALASFDLKPPDAEATL